MTNRRSIKKHSVTIERHSVTIENIHNENLSILRNYQMTFRMRNYKYT